MGDAEVHETERAGALGDQQVGGLDVPMDNAALMSVIEAGAQFRQPVHLPGQGHLIAGPDDLRHGPPGDELHGQVRVAFVLADRVDADDVRVVDLGRQARLAQEATARFLVGHLQDLDGDRTIEHRVEPEVHDAHAALAEAVSDFVRADMSWQLVHAGNPAVL